GWLRGVGTAELELVSVGWVGEVCGLPESAGGLFVSGGSMANLLSLATARHVVLRNKTLGAVVYCSDQTHFSVDRALQVLGFEATQVCKLPSDDSFRLSVAQLKQRVTADRAAGGGTP